MLVVGAEGSQNVLLITDQSNRKKLQEEIFRSKKITQAEAVALVFAAGKKPPIIPRVLAEALAELKLDGIVFEGEHNSFHVVFYKTSSEDRIEEVFNNYSLFLNDTIKGNLQAAVVVADGKQQSTNPLAEYLHTDQFAVFDISNQEVFVGTKENIAKLKGLEEIALKFSDFMKLLPILAGTKPQKKRHPLIQFLIDQQALSENSLARIVKKGQGKEVLIICKKDEKPVGDAIKTAIDTLSFTIDSEAFRSPGKTLQDTIATLKAEKVISENYITYTTKQDTRIMISQQEWKTLANYKRDYYQPSPSTSAILGLIAVKDVKEIKAKPQNKSTPAKFAANCINLGIECQVVDGKGKDSMGIVGLTQANKVKLESLLAKFIVVPKKAFDFVSPRLKDPSAHYYGDVGEKNGEQYVLFKGSTQAFKKLYLACAPDFVKSQNSGEIINDVRLYGDNQYCDASEVQTLPKSDILQENLDQWKRGKLLSPSDSDS